VIERKRGKERKREITEERKKETRNRSGAEIVATNVTAATVHMPDVKSSRPAFKEQRGKETKRESV